MQTEFLFLIVIVLVALAATAKFLFGVGSDLGELNKLQQKHSRPDDTRNNETDPWTQ